MGNGWSIPTHEDKKKRLRLVQLLSSCAFACVRACVQHQPMSLQHVEHLRLVYIIQIELSDKIQGFSCQPSRHERCACERSRVRGCAPLVCPKQHLPMRACVLTYVLTYVMSILFGGNVPYPSLGRAFSFPHQLPIPIRRKLPK